MKIDAMTLADVIIEHAKRNEQHAIYALIRARDEIWMDEVALWKERCESVQRDAAASEAAYDRLFSDAH